MARLGDILVHRGYISAAQLEAALAAQGAERGMLGRVLVRRGLITMEHGYVVIHRPRELERLEGCVIS